MNKVEQAYNHAKRVLLANKHLPPTFFAYSDTEVHRIEIELPYTYKNVILSCLSLYFLAHDITSYVTITESWMGRYPSGLLPRNDPERQEVLIVTEIKADGTQEHKLGVLHRKRNGKLHVIEPLEIEGVTLGGTFTELFPQDRDIPVSREQTLQVLERFGAKIEVQPYV